MASRVSQSKRPAAQPSTPVGVADRILQTATKLFLVHGYQQTGINQIIAESATAKASFYQYYATKDDLGRAYLRAYGERNLALLDRLHERNPAPLDFITAWSGIVKREARRQELYGCPMANLRAQLADSSPALRQAIAELSRQTLQRLTGYLQAAKKSGHVSADANAPLLARRLFSLYEGTLQTWRLTGDAAALNDLVPMAADVFARDK